MMRHAVIVAVLVGCGPRPEAVAANAMAAAVVVAATAVEHTYVARIDACAELADDEVSDCITATVDAYEPAWASLMAYSEAHDLMADAIDSGEAPDVERVVATFCALRYALRVHGIEIADVGVCR